MPLIQEIGGHPKQITCKEYDKDCCHRLSVILENSGIPLLVFALDVPLPVGEMLLQHVVHVAEQRYPVAADGLHDALYPLMELLAQVDGLAQPRAYGRLVDEQAEVFALMGWLDIRMFRPVGTGVSGSTARGTAWAGRSSLNEAMMELSSSSVRLIFFRSPIAISR